MHKYYLPTAEDFHIGFRFERDITSKIDPLYYEGAYQWGPKVYLKSTYGVYEEGRVIFTAPLLTGREVSKIDVLKFSIFVKYLDKEDIEELGWKDTTDRDTKRVGDLKETFTITPHPRRTYTLKYGQGVVEICLIHHKIKQLDKVVFKGRLKNYNELKTIMKQVGI